MSQHASDTERERRERQLKNAFLSIMYTSELNRRDALKGLAGMGLAGATLLFANPLAAHAEPQATQETLDALSDAQAQADAVQAQLNDLAAQFQALSEQQDQTLQQIEDVQTQIDATQAQIDEKQAELEKKQDGLGNRMATSYKSGGNDALTLLLSSTSFNELISNVYYIDKLNENDREAIEEINRIRQELEDQKAELERQRADLEVLREQQTQQLADMQAKQAEVQEVLTGLNADVQQLMAQRDAEILAAAEAEARAAEEARRQQEASSGGGGYIPEVGSGQDYNAASSAQKRIVNACYATPSPGVGYCAAWVSRVFQRAGFGYVGGNACDMYARWCNHSRKADLQVGMIIAVSTHSHTSAGRIYGHVGIYIGDNRVMENIGAINTNSLDSWCSYYGTTVTPRWGWASGIDLTQQS